MATPKTLNNDPTQKHTHRPSVTIDEFTDTCPLCGQPVPKSQHTALQKKLDADLRARLKEAEKGLREGFEQRVRLETEKTRREAARAAEAQIKALKATQ